MGLTCGLKVLFLYYIVKHNARCHIKIVKERKNIIYKPQFEQNFNPVVL